MSVLALLAFAGPAKADCGEFILGSSPLSEKIYREALTQNALPIAGVLPEEVLAILGRENPAVDLFSALVNDLKIERIRWGSSFRIKGGRFTERLLVMKRIDFSTPEKKKQYWLEFAQALFAEKQRQLKFAGPQKYLNELTAFSEKLGVLTGEVEPQKINWVTYGLRSIVGWLPQGKQFPSTKPRLGIHFALTRVFAAIWIATMAVNVVHVPKAIETIEMLGQYKDVAWSVVEEFTGPGVQIDPIGDREIILKQYEEKLAALETRIVEADPGDVESLQQSIDMYKDLIEKFKRDIAALKKT